MQYITFKSAATRIAQLESQLGVPAEPPPFNIGLANQRIRQLEAMAAKITPAKVAASRTPQPKAAQISLEKLAALHAGMFGENETQNIMRGRNEVSDAGLARWKSANLACDDAARNYGHNAPGSIKASEHRAKVYADNEAERVGSEADQFRRLATDIASKGVTIPGLNLSGVTPRPGERMAAHTIQSANEFASAWCEYVNEPSKAVVATGQAAKFAREFIAQMKGSR